MRQLRQTGNRSQGRRLLPRSAETRSPSSSSPTVPSSTSTLLTAPRRALQQTTTSACIRTSTIYDYPSCAPATASASAVSTARLRRRRRRDNQPCAAWSRPTPPSSCESCSPRRSAHSVRQTTRSVSECSQSPRLSTHTRRSGLFLLPIFSMVSRDQDNDRRQCI